MLGFINVISKPHMLKSARKWDAILRCMVVVDLVVDPSKGLQRNATNAGVNFVFWYTQPVSTSMSFLESSVV
jgi:hypothetical protein